MAAFIYSGVQWQVIATGLNSLAKDADVNAVKFEVPLNSMGSVEEEE
jgi:hypothetical protein